MTASVFGWLVANGLWPSSLSATVYWGIPICLGFIFGRRVLGRLLAIARRHLAALEKLAAGACAVAAYHRADQHERAAAGCEAVGGHQQAQVLRERAQTCRQNGDALLTPYIQREET